MFLPMCKIKKIHGRKKINYSQNLNPTNLQSLLEEFAAEKTIEHPWIMYLPSDSVSQQ